MCQFLIKIQSSFLLATENVSIAIQQKAATIHGLLILKVRDIALMKKLM